jgi:hypothetical protein
MNFVSRNINRGLLWAVQACNLLQRHHRQLVKVSCYTFGYPLNKMTCTLFCVTNIDRSGYD